MVGGHNIRKGYLLSIVRQRARSTILRSTGGTSQQANFEK